MEWNLIKWIMKRREKKAQLKRLGELGEVFKTLNKLERGGLLTWDAVKRRLFIAEPLAEVEMGLGAEGWKAFLHNVWLWKYMMEVESSWDNYMMKEMAKAVIKRKKEVTVLTTAEAERVRRARRDEVAQDDKAEVEVKGFELFVVGEKDGGAEVMVVGRYEPETEMVEMAMWEDVREAMRRVKREEGRVKREEDVQEGVSGLLGRVGE